MVSRGMEALPGMCKSQIQNMNRSQKSTVLHDQSEAELKTGQMSTISNTILVVYNQFTKMVYFIATTESITAEELA